MERTTAITRLSFHRTGARCPTCVYVHNEDDDDDDDDDDNDDDHDDKTTTITMVTMVRVMY
jgi:hypothetical protein